jgi:hypothetical protein
MANSMEGPKFAAIVITFDWNGEGPVFPNPPFRSIQRPFAFQGTTAPAAKFRLPLLAAEEAIGDHGKLVACCDVFPLPWDKAFRSNDSVALQYISNVGKGLYIDFGIELMREDDLKCLCHIREHAVNICMGKYEARHVVAPSAKAAIGAPLKTNDYFEGSAAH